MGPVLSAVYESFPSGDIAYVPAPTTSVGDVTACACDRTQCPPSVHGRRSDPLSDPPVHDSDAASAIVGNARMSATAPSMNANRFMILSVCSPPRPLSVPGLAAGETGHGLDRRDRNRRHTLRPKCRRGDLNPHAPQGALGPQPSASTKFRHSDVARGILPTPKTRPETSGPSTTSTTARRPPRPR